MYTNLEVAIVKSHLKKSEIAEKLNLKTVAFYRRLRGVVKWRGDERERLAVIINNTLGTNYTVKYLFKEI